MMDFNPLGIVFPGSEYLSQVSHVFLASNFGLVYSFYICIVYLMYGSSRFEGLWNGFLANPRVSFWLLLDHISSWEDVVFMIWVLGIC